MDNSTQQNASAVEDAALAAQRMLEQAGTLARLVDTFKLVDAPASAWAGDTRAPSRAGPGSNVLALGARTPALAANRGQRRVS